MRVLWCLAALLLVVGCGGGSQAGSAAPSPTWTVSPTPSTPSSEHVCTTQVLYWSRTVLTEGPYQGGDYQHMGLSATQNEVLRAVLSLVAPIAAADGVDAAMVTVEQEAPVRCVEAYASGTPTSAW